MPPSLPFGHLHIHGCASPPEGTPRQPDALYTLAPSGAAATGQR
jgi:hypothetical protein